MTLSFSCHFTIHLSILYRFTIIKDVYVWVFVSLLSFLRNFCLYFRITRYSVCYCKNKFQFALMNIIDMLPSFMKYYITFVKGFFWRNELCKTILIDLYLYRFLFSSSDEWINKLIFNVHSTDSRICNMTPSFSPFLLHRPVFARYLKQPRQRLPSISRV